MVGGGGGGGRAGGHGCFPCVGDNKIPARREHYPSGRGSLADAFFAQMGLGKLKVYSVPLPADHCPHRSSRHNRFSCALKAQARASVQARLHRKSVTNTNKESVKPRESLFHCPSTTSLGIVDHHVSVDRVLFCPLGLRKLPIRDSALHQKQTINIYIKKHLSSLFFSQY